MVAWAVTDPALIKRLLTDPCISKDAHQHWPAFIDGRIPPAWPLAPWVQVRNALSAYGPEHTRLRGLLSRAFTPRRVDAMRPAVERITAELLDDFGPATRGVSVDLRARFAHQLPLLVISDLFGLPAHFHDGFRQGVAALFATNLTAAESQANAERIYALLADLVQIKRTEPGDDLTSALISARDDAGHHLSEQELLDTLLLFIGAGHETTVNLLTHAVVNLLTHPNQLQAALTQGDWNPVIHETLRHQAPVANLIMRFPTQDVQDEPTGLTFRAGEPIMISYGAAGRDQSVHGSNADAFDAARPTRTTHLAFGHGPHFCLGAPLAILEANIALAALFSRYPHLALAAPADRLEPLPSFISNGHRTLPVLLTPASPPHPTPPPATRNTA